MTLVFGCRHPEEDHLYQEEMQEMVLKGVLFQVHTGYSRLPGKPKVRASWQSVPDGYCPGLYGPSSSSLPLCSTVKTDAQRQGDRKSTKIIYKTHCSLIFTAQPPAGAQQLWDAGLC